MWFIKTEFRDEFNLLINEFANEQEIIRKIKTIQEIESFCKQGKGISFYNRTIINNKFANEVIKYRNDVNYFEYGTKMI